MKKSIATKWIKALRSGKYKQGKEALRIEDRFCCLGVLSDLCDKSGWSESGNYKRCSNGLHKSVLEWSGMSTHSDKDIKNNCYEYNVFLAVKNDQGWSFKKIANWIEKNWKKL